MKLYSEKDLKPFIDPPHVEEPRELEIMNAFMEKFPGNYLTWHPEKDRYEIHVRTLVR